MKLRRDELERSVAQFRMPEPAMDRLVARRRRHSRRQRAAAAVAAIAVVVLVLAAFGRSFTTTKPATGANYPAPSWRSADVDGTEFTNPGGSAFDGVLRRHCPARRTRELRPDLSGSNPCEGMPNDGAILVIDPQADGRAPVWPTSLTGPDASGLTCKTDALGARWSAHGRTYHAVASFGDSVAPATRDALMRAFSGLSFVGATIATSTSSSCFVKDGYSTLSGEVIAGDTTSDLPWTVYQLGIGSGCLPDGGIALVTADPGYQFATLPPPIAGGSSLDVHDTKVGESSYVAGIVGTDVSSVDVSLADSYPETGRRSRHSHPSSPIGRYFAPMKTFQQGLVTDGGRRAAIRRCCGRASGRGWIVRTGVCAESASARERRSLRTRMPLRPIDSWSWAGTSSCKTVWG